MESGVSGSHPVLTDANHCGGCDAPCTPESPETCGETGACAGGTCSLYGVETVCRAASCEGSVLIRSATCDGVGNCPPEVQETCDDGITCTDDLCDPVDETCSHVANDDFCEPGFYCHLAHDCTPTTETSCDDTIDNDRDGLVDELDSDCPSGMSTLRR